MAFSDVLQTLGRVIGLFPGDNDESNYRNDSRYDDYPQGGDSYQEQPEEPSYDEPVYESGYGDSGAYGRAGARLRQPSRRASRFAEREREQQRYEQPRQPQPARGYRQERAEQTRFQRPGNVIDMPERGREYDSPLPKAQSVQTGTIIFCVRRKDDSSQIINYLLEGLNVILNFEDVDDLLFRRAVPTRAGYGFRRGVRAARLGRAHFPQELSRRPYRRGNRAARGFRPRRARSAGSPRRVRRLRRMVNR